MANDGQGNEEHGLQGSTFVRAAAAAAATGAAAYAINRVRSHRNDDDRSQRDDAGDDDNGNGGVLAMKDDLAQTLSSKASDVKERAGKLRPKKGNQSASSIAGSAWESASQHLIPVAGQAAEAAGEALAQRSPDLVREELMPKFIKGFQKRS